MAFSGSSYFAGIGTAFAAIAVGFAGGAMITTNTVQPPNRLERVNAGPIAPSNADVTPASGAPSGQEQATKPSSEAPASTAAATPSPPSTNSPAPQPTAPAAVKTDAAANGQDQPAPASTAKTPPPSPAAKSEDPAPAKTEHAGTRSADANRETSRRRADDRRFSDRSRYSERRRRQDQGERRLDEATNVAPQTPRNDTVGLAIDQRPRIGGRPRHIETYEDDDRPPRLVSEPPPRFFSFFGE